MFQGGSHISMTFDIFGPGGMKIGGPLFCDSSIRFIVQKLKYNHTV